jgi:hypothetical protein
MVEIDEDTFSCILCHISDLKELYAILLALPKSHLLFPVALTRLWELPVYLDTYDPRSTTASQKILDYLLGAENPQPLAQSVRHLIISIEHEGPSRIGPPGTPWDVLELQERLPDLFLRTINLESLDYHSFPGIGMKKNQVEPLRHLERLRRFGVDCALREWGNEIPSAGGDYANPGDLSARYDAENWE